MNKRSIYILGINAYHGDSSAALIKDGKLVAAIEEERIRRIKHWAGFPGESIKFCLDYAGIGIKDVDYVAISRNPFARFHKKIARVILKMPKLSFLKSRFDNLQKIKGVEENLADIFGIKPDGIKAKIVNVEHHRAHLASSFFFSPFEKAAVVSIDGFGDFVSTMSGTGENNSIKIHDLVEFPHSLGIFYTALTQFLGFWKYGDEYKVMGLSAFGKPVYLDQMRKIVKLKDDGFFELDLSYFIHDKGGVEMTWLDGEPKIGKLFSDKLAGLLGEPRKEGEEVGEKFKNIAASIQAMYEEAFFHILNNLHKKVKTENIALAGGCLQNSLANGKIYGKTLFKNVFIPPAAHDAGGAMGAAMYVWNQLLKKERVFLMTSPFWGPKYGNGELKKILEDKKLEFRHLSDDELIKTTAKLLAESKVVGWFQGRTEWGPRALGNRSILANPCNPNMKDILNLKIKKRESFRPFAPAILEEEVLNYFSVPGGSGKGGEKFYAVPFMEKVFSVKEEKRKLIPAVVHVDGTGRLQTVSRENNRLYYELIKEFGRLTGTPILINTSFNENEPIVNKPEEAVDCYLRTEMDVLVLGNYIVERK